jgi:4a-hydroxytetrahydrobiopterin dehydratase
LSSRDFRCAAVLEHDMSKKLVERRCKPCEGGVKPLQAGQVAELMRALHPDWSLSDDGLEISRTFSFPSYSYTLAFANAAAWVAVSEGHHPVLTLRYGDCTVSYTTHAISGLSDNDFICAAKTDQLARDGIG